MIVGVVLLVVGLIGLVSNFSIFLMWALVIAGVVGILWGWMNKGGGPETKK
jgi:hypothetical protein